MSMLIKRGIFIILGLFIQIALLVIIGVFFVEKIAFIGIIYFIIEVIILLSLIKNASNFSFILPWIILILLFPIPGTLLYIIVTENRSNSKVLKTIVKNEKNSKKYFIQDEKTKKSFKDNSRLRYITDYANLTVTNNNDIEYYPLGELVFPEMLKELKKAEKFIFFEYFIVHEGKMWNSILEILEEKAKNGVDVRVMYDDLGCITTLKSNYAHFLESKGIKCVVFNKLKFLGGVIMNNRDHRKILVIDGKVAFSGGINIADEYINIGSKYGHWKDNGIKIKGDAVWSYTVMFLTIWNSFVKMDTDYTKYKYEYKGKKAYDDFVAPYSQTPLRREKIGENIYLNIINQANNYVYICTPYLIIDHNMLSALELAAKRGVDVRIIIPGIPDKKIVYTLSESYVTPLVKAGVKVYKYTPGFIHAKVFVADDYIATVGTINLDYRSLYLHFECGLYMEKSKVIKDIKKDVVETIEKSHEVTKKEAKPGFFKELGQALLRLFAPLM